MNKSIHKIMDDLRNYQKSYKFVVYKAFLDTQKNGKADILQMMKYIKNFYLNRKKKGLKIEASNSASEIINIENTCRDKLQKYIERMPLDKLNTLNKKDNIIEMDKSIWDALNHSDLEDVYNNIETKLVGYYRDKVGTEYSAEKYSNNKTNYKRGDSAEVNVWWVNQGKTLKAEKEEGILWAPLKDKGGNSVHHWERLKEVEKGDIILHYSNGSLRYVSKVLSVAEEKNKPKILNDTDNWEEIGLLVKVEYHKLEPEIKKNKFNHRVKSLNIDKGPINVNGNVNQGYLFNFSNKALEIIQRSQPETKWPNFAIIDKMYVSEETEDYNPEQLINQISNYISQKGFTYPPGLIENFYLSLKTKPFVL
ncbi:MAG: hypothetical protein ACOCRK_01860, partial [bacterium]